MTSSLQVAERARARWSYPGAHVIQSMPCCRGSCRKDFLWKLQLHAVVAVVALEGTHKHLVERPVVVGGKSKEAKYLGSSREGARRKAEPDEIIAWGFLIGRVESRAEGERLEPRELS